MRDAEEQALNRRRRELANRCRKLDAIVGALGDWLARLPDDASDGDAITHFFHDAVVQRRNAEMALEVIRERR
jgi:hypothetical protein